MPPEPKPGKVVGTDKMPVADYVEAVLDGIAEGIDRFEKRRPDWRSPGGKIEPVVVLKPVKVERGGKTYTEVWVDLDEPEKFPRTTLPLTIVRRPGDADDWREG